VVGAAPLFDTFSVWFPPLKKLWLFMAALLSISLRLWLFKPQNLVAIYLHCAGTELSRLCAYLLSFRHFEGSF